MSGPTGVGRNVGLSGTLMMLWHVWPWWTLPAALSSNGRLKSTRCNQMQNVTQKYWRPMLLSLTILLASCASRSSCPPPPEPPRLPQLPSYAAQPPQMQWCDPSCAGGLSKELKSWRQLLTETERQD